MLNPKVRFWQQDGEFYIFFDSIEEVYTEGYMCGGGDLSKPELSLVVMDKNGLELYEGDRIKILDEDELEDIEVFSALSAGYMMSECLIIEGQFEIVGNVNENPKTSRMSSQ